MKIVFSIAVLLVLSFPTFSQKVISKNIGTAEILYQENGVTITSQLTECNNTERGEIMQFKLLTISNSNNAPVALKVREDMFYDNKCYTCENDEYTHTFNLEANESKAGSCYGESNPLLAVFHSMKDGYIKEVLSDFKMNVVRLF